MIISDRRCRVCGAFWAKNHMWDKAGKAWHVGYYHLCSNGELLRVDHDMRERVWDAPQGKWVQNETLRLGGLTG